VLKPRKRQCVGTRSTANPRSSFTDLDAPTRLCKSDRRREPIGPGTDDNGIDTTQPGSPARGTERAPARVQTAHVFTIMTRIS
jgi:hypothetical protein